MNLEPLIEAVANKINEIDTLSFILICGMATFVYYQYTMNKKIKSIDKSVNNIDKDDGDYKGIGVRDIIKMMMAKIEDLQKDIRENREDLKEVRNDIREHREIDAKVHQELLEKINNRI